MNFKVDLLVLLSVAFTCVQCQRGSYAGNSGFVSQRYQNTNQDSSNQIQQQPIVNNIAPSSFNRIEQSGVPAVQYPDNLNGFNNQPNNFANFFHQPGFVQPQNGFSGFGFPALGRR
jgi:hypothetical protein